MIDNNISLLDGDARTFTGNVGTVANKLNKVNPVYVTYVNFYLGMGVPERFYWFSIQATPASREYFLSPEEMYD